MTEFERTPDGPILLPPPEQIIATRADIDAAKGELRRDIKVWVGIACTAGTTLSGLLASALSPAKVQSTGEAVAQALLHLPL